MKTSNMTPKQKAAYWARIKAEIPTLADFIIELSEKFGKPDVEITKWPKQTAKNVDIQ